MLCVYQSSRKGAHAEAFLKDFAGYLHADGCRGCYKLPGNIRVVGCWAHARRKFDEPLNAIPLDKAEQQPGEAEHQALRHRTEELPLRQLPPGRPEQRRHLQPD